jgi:hypothetical protein
MAGVLLLNIRFQSDIRELLKNEVLPGPAYKRLWVPAPVPISVCAAVVASARFFGSLLAADPAYVSIIVDIDVVSGGDF